MPPKKRLRLSSTRAKANNKAKAEVAKAKAALIGNLNVEVPCNVPLIPCVIEPLLPCVNLHSLFSSSKNYQSPPRQTNSQDKIQLQAEQQSEQVHSSTRSICEKIPGSPCHSRYSRSKERTTYETLDDPQSLSEMPTALHIVDFHLQNDFNDEIKETSYGEKETLADTQSQQPKISDCPTEGIRYQSDEISFCANKKKKGPRPIGLSNAAKKKKLLKQKANLSCIASEKEEDNLKNRKLKLKKASYQRIYRDRKKQTAIEAISPNSQNILNTAKAKSQMKISSTSIFYEIPKKSNLIVHKDTSQCLPVWISDKDQEIQVKKATYQRKYLDGVRRRANESIHLNNRGELLSLDMVYGPSANQLANAERDPVAALMAMAMNSGLDRFVGTSQLMENWKIISQLHHDEDGVPSYIADLKSEIQQNVTEDDSGPIVDDFLQRFHLDALLLACGSCGQKTYNLGNVRHHSVPLIQLDPLKMSVEELATLLALPAEYRQVASFYTASDGTYYHLHPEFVRAIADHEGVDVDETILCDVCYEVVVQRKKVPTHSLAAGMDFGNTDRIGLPPLTIPEEYVISQSRLLVSIIKLSGYQDAERQSGKLGHVIVFPQDSKQLEEEVRRSQIEHDRGTYPRLDKLHENISVTFVGSQLQWSAFVPNRRAFQRHVEVRVDVVYRWLRMLKGVNPKYKDIVIDDSPEMLSSLQQIPVDLMERATIIDHETDIGIDRIIAEQSNPGGSMSNEDFDHAEVDVEKHTGRLPTTYLTRSSRPNISNASTATALLQGVSAAFSESNSFDETSDSNSVSKASECESQTEGSSTGFSNSATVMNETDTIINVEQGRDPLNEFEQNDHLFYSCFPHLFPLGKGLRKFGSIPRSDVKHMIRQANNKMAECLRFIFVLFDQWQRHEATRVIAATVKSNQKSMDAFSELVADPLFIKKIEEAKNHPEDASSKALMAKIMPHLSLCNSRVPYTVAERKASVGHLLNLVRYYGTPSIFFTFSPDDTHGTLNLRMALPFADNWTFPATESGFTQTIREGHKTFQNIPVSQAALRTLLARGPVAAAEIFRLLVDNVFLTLLGTPPDNCKNKKTISQTKRSTGVFGMPIAAFGCTEEQARGSLHMHIVFWGGLTPALLQAVDGVACLQREITQAIERTIVAELQPVTHLRHLIRDLHDVRPAHAALYETHHPIRETEKFNEDCERTIDLSNIHHHTHTCYKTKPGERCCRLGRPMHLEEETGCEEIIAVKVDPDKATVSFDVLPNIRPPLLSTTRERCFSTMPIAMRDTRLVMHYHRRPLICAPRSSSMTDVPGTSPEKDTLELSNEDQEAFDSLSSELQSKVVRALISRNGLVVEYNRISSALLRCNTNASMLGGDAQAKAALAYLLKYVTKPPAELAHTLSVLHHARRTVDLNPSKAEDSGTVRRTGMHYLNRIINQLSGAIEISAGMAAAALLGMPGETCSASFWIAFVTAGIAYTRLHPEFYPEESEENEFSNIDVPPCESDEEEERMADDDSIIEDDVIMEDDVIDEERIQVDRIPQPTASTSAALEEIFNETEPIVLGPEEEQRPSEQTEQLTVSSATIYKSAGKVVAVPQHLHYAFRGPSLFMLTLYEYVAIIDVVPIIRKMVAEEVRTTGPDLGGRAANGTFPFATTHPLYATHIQRIRSKTKIPLLVGPPPQMPAPKPLELVDAWKRQARQCANYYLVLYKPWEVQTSDGGTLPGSVTWRDLCLYMRELECGCNSSHPSFLNRIRSKWITNAAHGLRIAGNDRTAAQKYRTRSASVWSKPDASESIGILRPQDENEDIEASGSRRLEEEAAVKAQEAIDLLRGQTAVDDLLERSNHRALEFYEQTRLALARIFQPPTAQTAQNPIGIENARQFLQADSQQSAADISQITSRLKEDAVILVPESLSDDENEATVFPNENVNEPVPTLSSQLNSIQKKVWSAVTTYFAELVNFKEGRRTRPEPFRLLLHGGPGTGKSFLARCLDQAASDHGLGMACIAPTGIAASNLPRGRTVHNFCGFPIQRSTTKFLEKPNNIKLASLQERSQNQSLALLLIDEVSNLGPEIFGQLEKRMKEIMECDEPFGGLAVILMGDFFQLPPVLPGETLYAALLSLVWSGTNLNPKSTFTGPRMQGARWFATFKKLELTQQMRAANDPQHMAFLNQLRSICIDPKPRSLHSLRLLKTITQQDVLLDPNWSTAPIVVTSNEERCRINEQQSIMLAKNLKCARIVWFQPILGIVANGLDSAQTNFIYTNCRQFKGVFVAGAPGFLLENINPKRGLSNGTPVTFHSLILDPREDINRVLVEMIDPSGKDVVLEYNPTNVLVKVTGADPTDFVGITIVPGDVIIPLAQTTNNKPIKVTIPRRRDKISLQTKSHGIDMGFAITLHKIQGQTCQRLIVDLNHRPFMPQITFSGFYVAVSRVRRSEDLRIMPIQSSIGHLKYLLELQPPKQLVIWLNGFDDSGSWDAKKIANPRIISAKKRKRNPTNTPTESSKQCSKANETI